MEGEARDIQFVGMPSTGSSADCPHCRSTVPFPAVDPWLLVDGQLIAGTVEAFLCPRCRGIIDVVHNQIVEEPSPVVNLSELQVELAAKPMRFQR